MNHQNPGPPPLHRFIVNMEAYQHRIAILVFNGSFDKAARSGNR